MGSPIRRAPSHISMRCRISNMYRTILVVDDEESVRYALKRTLERDGYPVLEAEDGEEALQILGQKPVQLLISDHNMPKMTGVELFKLAGVRYPNVIRIMLTGDQDPEVPVRSINEAEVYRFLRKPWNAADLRTVIHFAFRVARLEEQKRRLVEMVREQLGETKRDRGEVESELLNMIEEELRNG